MIRKRFAPLLAVGLLGLAFSSSAQAAGGSVKAWGYNASGQIGNGTKGTEGCYCVAVPASVLGLSGVVQIEGGYEHGLALLDDGTVMSWGYNVRGQLGDGTTNDRLTAAPVPGLSNVIAVAGANESSAALLADGTVRAWGENNEGTLGTGDPGGPEKCELTGCSKTPIPVPGVSNVIAIAGGDEYFLALRADGTILGWGNNYYGMLGDGVGTQGGCDCVPSPVLVPGISNAVSVAAGGRIAAAILADGTLRNWGFNKFGELGAGSESTDACNCSGPVQPPVSGAVRAAAGDAYVLAQLSDGGVQAWGANAYGQLGIGFLSKGPCECVKVPTALPGPSPEAVSAGDVQTLALMPDGSGRSWGDGYFGQLGNGESSTGAGAKPPGPISSLAGASEISATEYGGYAIVGPKQNVRVEFAGAGSGKVGGEGVVCPPVCTTAVPQGQVEALRAIPDPGSGFAGFTGGCSGTGACQVKAGTDQVVTATFGPPKGTAITGATINHKKKKATFSFSAPGVVSGYECKLVKPKPKKRKKGKGAKKSAKKGKAPKAQFAPCFVQRGYNNLRPGSYSFEVRALNGLGIDAVPAKRTFKVKKPKPKPKPRKGRR